jgi:hypothetical protein
MMQPEPKPVIPLEYARPTALPAHHHWRRAARMCTALSALCVFIGWVLMFSDVETVIVTGPLLGLLGLGLILIAWQLRLMPAVMLGIGHCSICVLFVTLVNVRSWTPGGGDPVSRVDRHLRGLRDAAGHCIPDGATEEASGDCEIFPRIRRDKCRPNRTI